MLAWAGLECLGHGFGDPLLVALIALVSGFSGLILILLGVMGEYLGCLIREVKQRPLYLVESVYNLDPRPGASHQQKEE